MLLYLFVVGPFHSIFKNSDSMKRKNQWLELLSKRLWKLLAWIPWLTHLFTKNQWVLITLISPYHLIKFHFQNEIGANVIAVQKGPYFGTGNDKMIVLSANYDTLEDNPGYQLIIDLLIWLSIYQESMITDPEWRQYWKSPEYCRLWILCTLGKTLLFMFFMIWNIRYGLSVIRKIIKKSSF